MLLIATATAGVDPAFPSSASPFPPWFQRNPAARACSGDGSGVIPSSGVTPPSPSPPWYRVVDAAGRAWCLSIALVVVEHENPSGMGLWRGVLGLDWSEECPASCVAFKAAFSSCLRRASRLKYRLLLSEFGGEVVKEIGPPRNLQRCYTFLLQKNTIHLIWGFTRPDSDLVNVCSDNHAGPCTFKCLLLAVLGNFSSHHLELTQSPVQLSQFLVMCHGLSLQCLSRLPDTRTSNGWLDAGRGKQDDEGLSRPVLSPQVEARACDTRRFNRYSVLVLAGSSKSLLKQKKESKKQNF